MCWMKKTVLVFGNPLVEMDSLALKVAGRLKGRVKGFEFREVDSVEREEKGKDLYIMDVVEGAEKVQLVDDLEKLKVRQPVSVHDLGLAMQLRLLKKMGRLGKVKVIAIPAGMDAKEAAAGAEKVLERLV